MAILSNKKSLFSEQKKAAKKDEDRAVARNMGRNLNWTAFDNRMNASGTRSQMRL